MVRIGVRDLIFDELEQLFPHGPGLVAETLKVVRYLMAGEEGIDVSGDELTAEARAFHDVHGTVQVR